MRGQADQSAEVPRDVGRVPSDASEREGDAAGRENLLRRLAELPPWHPSRVADKTKHGDEPDRAWAVGPDDRGAQVRPDDREGWPDSADRGERGFWSEVRRLKELWHAHVDRWPDKQDQGAGPDRPDDPPGSWRGAGDRYLSPEDHAEAEKQIGLLREPEKAVTSLLKQIEHDNPHGGVLVGLEHRLKGADRLKEKIADKMRFKDLDGPAAAAAMIDDAVRYTFCVGSANYVPGHRYVQQGLESVGFKMTYCKNHWLADPQYKGVNSRWETPDGGRFELQFHTRESYFAKEQLTHPSYKRLRSPETDWDEIGELEEFQLLVSSAVPKPDAVELIPDLRGDSR